MTHIKFLVTKCFEENTKHSKLPLTEEEYLTMFSNREYQEVLKDILVGLNLLEGEG